MAADSTDFRKAAAEYLEGLRGAGAGLGGLGGVGVEGVGLAEQFAGWICPDVKSPQHVAAELARTQKDIADALGAELKREDGWSLLGTAKQLYRAGGEGRSFAGRAGGEGSIFRDDFWIVCADRLGVFGFLIRALCAPWDKLLFVLRKSAHKEQREGRGVHSSGSRTAANILMYPARLLRRSGPTPSLLLA